MHCTTETNQIRKTKSKTAIYQFNQTDDNDGIQPKNLKLGLILQQNVYTDFSTRSRIPVRVEKCLLVQYTQERWPQLM